MFCKKCGKYIQPGQNFCPTCGTPVENNNTESMGDTKVIPGLNNMEDMGDTKVIPNLNELENQKSFGNNTNSFDNIDDSDFPEEIEYVEESKGLIFRRNLKKNLNLIQTKMKNM